MTYFDQLGCMQTIHMASYIPHEYQHQSAAMLDTHSTRSANLINTLKNHKNRSELRGVRGCIVCIKQWSRSCRTESQGVSEGVSVRAWHLVFMVEILEKMVGVQELQQSLVVLFGQKHCVCTTATGLGSTLAERPAEA